MLTLPSFSSTDIVYPPEVIATICSAHCRSTTTNSDEGLDSSVLHVDGQRSQSTTSNSLKSTNKQKAAADSSHSRRANTNSVMNRNKTCIVLNLLINAYVNEKNGADLQKSISCFCSLPREIKIATHQTSSSVNQQMYNLASKTFSTTAVTAVPSSEMEM